METPKAPAPKKPKKEADLEPCAVCGAHVGLYTFFPTPTKAARRCGFCMAHKKILENS